MKTSTYLCSGFFSVFFALVCNDSFSQLKADFTSNVQSGCTPLIVVFQDKSTGGATQWTWDLGNGSTSINQNPSTTYSDPGTYTVKLTAKNGSSSNLITKTAYITVYATPQVGFNADPTQGCFPLDVKFTSSSKAGSGSISNYLWDFGDGYIDTTSGVVHTYTSPGVFDITLKITNSYGCYSALTKSDLIQINDGVNAGFSLSSLNICKTPATAIFKNESIGSGTLSYSWDFGDGGKSSTASPTHNYNSSGNYKVLLTVQSAGGCSDTATMPLVVAFPASSFKHTDATCLNQTIQFTNSSVPAPVSSIWYFGDGTTSTALNPGKAYTKTGSYTVKLVNVFSAGCSDSVTAVIDVASGPTAAFFADDTSQCAAPLTVNFTNKTTGAATDYLWDFGDGSTSILQNPSHNYIKQGIYTVKLTATNSNGCQDVLIKQNYINIQPVRITGFTDLPDSGCVPLTVKPTAKLNITAGIKKYTWDFGDGSTSNSQTPQHTYVTDGFFNVTLTIETEDGCTDTYTMKNAVLAGHKPKANFTVSEDTICSNNFVELTNTSTNGPITFVSWDFGPLLDASTGEHFIKSEVDTGYAKAVLIAYNYGCADTLEKDSIVYILPPIARIKFTQNCDDKLKVNFIDSSILPITRLWDFGDGNTSTQPNPSHNYSLPGTYTVSLFTTNKTCRDTIDVNVRVINETGVMSLPGKVFCRGNTISADITGINLANIKNTTWNFGDGTIITVNGATKASHIYLVNGNFKIKATMTDRNNCPYNYESPDSITVYGPLANFLSLTPGVCQGNTVSFTDRSSSDNIHNIVKWSWNYGDNVNHDYTNTASFSHSYPDTGYFTVRLTVTDSYGCSDSAKKQNYVFVSHPFASFKLSDSIACPGAQVSFQNTSSGNSLTYLWNFGDGFKNAQRSPSYTYKGTGVFYPDLFVMDVNGCMDTYQLPIKITNPTAKFFMSDSFSTCPPLQVDFSNKSSDYTTVLWNFGDGSPSNVVSPTHIYTIAGVYPVKLITTGHGICADTVTRNVIIKGPSGTMSYLATPACYPDTAKLTAKASNTALYTWDFSDGNTVTTTAAQVSYVYQPGSYIPKLILQDSLGCKVSIKGIDTLVIYDVQANATAIGKPECDSSHVLFTDISASKDMITHHYWNFGDGTTADQPSITHTYTKPGTYDVYIITETKRGCRDTFNIPTPISVLEVPQINISGDSAVCALASASFRGNSKVIDSTIAWGWDFGNGSTFSGINASAAYKKGGKYTVTLTAKNSGGCADTALSIINVNDAPVIYAGIDTSVCKSSTYQLNAAGGQTYTWSGNGLSCTNCASPIITPNALSVYTVTGKDALGCAASDTVSINIIAPGKIIAAGADTLCVGESTQLTASGALSYQWYPSLYLDNDKSAQPTFKAVKDTSITYKVVGFTAANCFADTGFVTIKAFPVPKLNILLNEIVLDAGSSVQLNSGSSGDITQWRWQPPQGLSNTAIANPVASPAQTTTYACVASNGGACVARDEITIRVVCKNTNVFIPNTFSPNNDGMNDRFYARGHGLFSIKAVRIFNRWGQIVFERGNTNPNVEAEGWNGTYNGKPAPSDVYVYMIDVLCQNNSVISFKGNVTLLR